MGRTRNGRLLIAWFAPAAGLVLGACAGAPTARTQIDARASAARTAAEHLAVAAEYEALARQEKDDSVRHSLDARREERTEELRSQGRFARSHPSITAGQWQLRSMAEARSAQEAASLAELHRAMAGADSGSRGKPGTGR